MNARALQRLMLDELGYANSLGLDESPEWESGRPIPDINSAYVVRGSRVLYFATLDHPDPDRLLDLYRSVWTESQVPLLLRDLAHRHSRLQLLCPAS